LHGAGKKSEKVTNRQPVALVDVPLGFSSLHERKEFLMKATLGLARFVIHFGFSFFDTPFFLRV